MKVFHAAHAEFGPSSIPDGNMIRATLLTQTKPTGAIVDEPKGIGNNTINVKATRGMEVKVQLYRCNIGDHDQTAMDEIVWNLRKQDIVETRAVYLGDAELVGESCKVEKTEDKGRTVTYGFTIKARVDNKHPALRDALLQQSSFVLLVVEAQGDLLEGVHETKAPSKNQRDVSDTVPSFDPEVQACGFKVGDKVSVPIDDGERRDVTVTAIEKDADGIYVLTCAWLGDKDIGQDGAWLAEEATLVPVEVPELPEARPYEFTDGSVLLRLLEAGDLEGEHDLTVVAAELNRRKPLVADDLLDSVAGIEHPVSMGDRSARANRGKKPVEA